MQEEDLNWKLDPAEHELERALADIMPASTSLQRDELVFQAGARSGRRSVRLWQCAAAVLVVGMGLAEFLHIEGNSPRFAQQLPRVPTSPSVSFVVIATPPQQPESPYSLAALRRDVLAGGVEALPTAPPSTNRGAGESPSPRPQSILNPFGDPL